MKTGENTLQIFAKKRINIPTDRMIDFTKKNN